jgi:hypothetical protein
MGPSVKSYLFWGALGFPANIHIRGQVLPKIKRSAQPLMLVLSLFALFSALTAILFWQWLPHLHSALIGPPEDNMQDFWNTWYASVAKKPEGFFLPI